MVSGNVGGAFGMKIFLHPEQPLVVWASRKLKRAVRWTGERSETFVSDVQGRDNYTIAELALDADAKFLALRVTTYANMGAYLSNFGPFIPQLAAVRALERVPHPGDRAEHQGRRHQHGPGRRLPRRRAARKGIYVVERMVDVAARELGLAPDEIRRRNFIDDLPVPDAGRERVRQRRLRRAR